MGILSAITSTFSPAAVSAPLSKPKVIVIGAGVSGLSCASELVNAGHPVLVLEARDRIGGRAHTYVDPKVNVPFDLGASFIHGLAGNPLAELAKEHKLKLFHPDSVAGPDPAVSHIWSPEGPPLPTELSNRLAFNSMRTAFETSVEHAQERPDGLPSDTEALADWVLDEKRSTLYDGLKSDQEKIYAKQMVGSWDGWTGADFHNVSLKYWQSDVTYSGGDATIVDGYRGIYEPLARIIQQHQGSEIKLSQEVTSVIYDEDSEKVTVETRDSPSAEQDSTHAYTAEYVVCTLPLGVLQQSPPSFYPPLSFRRREAINRLRMGLLNKIIVTYDKCFWPEKQAFLSFLPSTASESFLPILANRALFAQNYRPVTGTNTLVFYLGAETGAAMEKLTDDEVKNGIHGVLKHHFGKESSFPQAKDGGPKSIIVTRWLADPYSRGSYSYIRPAQQGDRNTPCPYDFAEVARPAWDNRLFFAGEATDADHYATVHGPLLTGRREGSRIRAAMDARIS
ncbi:amine oxidase [Cystobasidium minutum MCA 4210]|uniref:amine oxidase n=1 Tax=Cystobasidium minutum MCA 4210 TaxID=1397322 RepID=UPI0034CE6D03|eukprot:jgi/Rhomi1/194863/gm1.3077_g